ncbi:TadE/TadG family type IV pilus assembly protein [Sphingomonas sp. Leaf23]|uniref:TadE/TadG family type IV pilus assembly protein n=1 Tax=Sphingomonas sp. Leaf23 TaxID=1735689 RepID=UPI0009E7A212|nr:TadE/TadG family type IV pilus assembly protein [Sphingomonas sp. Leaf23]
MIPTTFASVSGTRDAAIVRTPPHRRVVRSAAPGQALRKLRIGRWWRHLMRDRRGTAVIELALALPILTIFLFGIVSGGSWLAMAHVVQESANEGARAALAGITASERASLATQAALQTLSRSYGIRGEEITLKVDDDGRQLTVKVAYDGSANPLLKLPIVPAATTTIRRQASVVLAGF